jgi:glycosyltransferase involved in cell wall biosynthesis
LTTAAALRPDLLHLHWIVEGFVQIEAMRRLPAPIVWTLHDSWPFTGGCHLPGNCRRYEKSCGCCPVLGSSREGDLSRRVWARKRTAWRKLQLTCVAPSRWLADCARASSLLRDHRVEVIPNGVDTALYRPADQRAAREALRLPTDRRLILFGANHALSDVNKGFDLLHASLKSLEPVQRNKAELVVFGDHTGRQIPPCGLPVRNLGIVTDESRIVLLYQAADLFVAPSRQENLPNMVLEAMACGTPCVAFDVGGLPDLINHGTNGYLARPYEAEDFCRGISWVLADETRRLTMASLSREKIVSGFSLEQVAGRYFELYRELVSTKEG